MHVPSPSVTSIVAVVAAAAFSAGASAHITYTGRNFGTLTTSAVSINNQTVSSAYGWADATDGDWGDTHRTRFYRFNVAADNTQVSITVKRNSLGSGAAGTFLSAFSLYSGLAQLAPANLGHDFSALSRQWLTDTFGSSAGFGLNGSGKEGVLNALGDWSVGNSVSETVIDPSDSLRSFAYIGHAADGTSANYGAAAGINGDGLADGFVTATFNLAAGDYSLSVGGANYAAQLVETGPIFPTYGVDVTVGVVPAPGAIAMVGLAGAAARRRRVAGHDSPLSRLRCAHGE